MKTSNWRLILGSKPSALPLKLIAMTNDRPPNPSAKSRPRTGFRERYDDLEAYRLALMARLTSLGEAGHQHPGYKRALKLLNDTFRKSKLAQRLAILQAAAWLIDILEKITLIT